MSPTTPDVAGQQVDTSPEKTLKLVDPMDPEAFYSGVSDGTESETLTTIHGTVIKGEKKTEGAKEEPEPSAEEPEVPVEPEAAKGPDDAPASAKSKDNTVSGRIRELTDKLHEARTRELEKAQTAQSLEEENRILREKLDEAARAPNKSAAQAGKDAAKPADGRPDKKDDKYYDADTGEFLLDAYNDDFVEWKLAQAGAKEKKPDAPTAEQRFISDMKKFDAADVEYGKTNPEWKEVAPSFGQFLLNKDGTPRFPHLTYRVFNHEAPVELAHALATDKEAAYKAAELYGAALDSHLSYVLGRFRAKRETAAKKEVVEVPKAAGSLFEPQPHVVTGAGVARSAVDPKTATMDQYMQAMGTG